MAKKKTEPAKKSLGVACTIKQVPEKDRIVAAQQAIIINPVNMPPPEALMAMSTALMEESDDDPVPGFLALLTSKYWGAAGVELTVGFMESTPADLRDRIISHMNAWNKTGNILFRYSQTSPQVRITRSDEGYWSYMGTDIRMISSNEATMCLSGFTMRTREEEFRRVVRHEAGHTLGFPHEHMRQQLIARLDREATYRYFQRTQGWSRSMVDSQVLTPLEERSIRGTPDADDESIMCYQLPGDITRDRQPIPGGSDINDMDYQFVGTIYPKADKPIDPPAKGGLITTLVGLDKDGKEVARFKQ